MNAAKKPTPKPAPQPANWTPLKDKLPPENVEVEVITPGGDQRTLVYASNLWWLPDRSMYVYFTPVVWRLLP